MKTLEETNHLVHAFVEAAVKKHQAEWYDDAVSYARFSEATIEARLTLFAALAAWDAVLTECLPAIKAEYEGLKALKDAVTPNTRIVASKRIKTSGGCVLEGAGMEIWDATITACGLARLEYLRGILGE